MAKTDLESTTIERALVFYQQHLLSERQRHERELPNNGKLAANSEDVSRDDSYDRQLRAVATILESQRRSLKPTLGDITGLKLSSPTDRQAANLVEPDTEPYIDPFTGRLVVPNTKFTPESSNLGSVPDKWERVEAVRPLAIINEPPLHKRSGSSLVDVISNSSDPKAAESTRWTKYQPPKSSSTKRKPVNSRHAPSGQISVPLLPELSTPTIPAQISFPRTSSPYLSSQIAASLTAVEQHGQYDFKEMLDQGPHLIKTESLEPKRAPENPKSKPFHFERQIQRPTRSFNVQETPETLVTTSTAAKTTPPATAMFRTGQEPSWQSETWNYVNAAAQKPLPPTSIRSPASHEGSWSSFHPVPGSQRTSSASSANSMSQGYRTPFRSSVSTDEVNIRPSSKMAQHRAQPSWPSPPPNPAINMPAVSLRPQPSFSTVELGKFGSGDGSGIKLVSPSHPQPMSGTPKLGQSQNESGGGSLQRQAELAIHATEVGTFPSGQKGGHSFNPPGSSEQIKTHPRLWRPGLSGDSNPFSLPAFPDDQSAAANKAQLSNMMINDPRQPVFSSSRQRSFDQSSTFSNRTTEQTENKYQSYSAIAHDPLRPVSDRTQQVAGFDGEARSSNEISCSRFSARLTSGDHSFDRQQLDPMRPRGHVFQGGLVPPHTSPSIGPSLQDAHCFGAIYDLSNRPAQGTNGFVSQEAQNGIFPNQLKPNGLRSEKSSNAHHGISGETSYNGRAFTSLGGHNHMVPNGLKGDEFKSNLSTNKRRDSLNQTSQDQCDFRSSGNQKGIIPNQLKPSGSRLENHTPTVDQFARTIKITSSRQQPTLLGTQFNSQVDEDFQFAETIAHQEGYDELAALQRMQDEWNREEDSREAKQQSFTPRFQNDQDSSLAQNFGYQQRYSTFSPPVPGSYPDPGSWKRSRRDSNDSVHFAASPNADDQQHSNIIVNPVKSTPSKPQRPATPRASISGAKTAAHDERNELETQARLEKERADRAAAKAKNQVECTVCTDAEDKSQMTLLPCNHAYHGLCLASAFQHALAGGKLFICCNQTPAPIDLAASHLPAQFVTNYKVKVVERSTANPIYCAKPGCATFIPPTNLKGPMATCPTCGFVTCSLCKNPEHKGVCPPDKNGEKLLNLANNKNWTQCQRCKAMIERYDGCLHMTCPCGHEFCYLCGNKWANCGGKCPRK